MPARKISRCGAPAGAAASARANPRAAAFAGVPVPERYQGKSLKPVVTAGKPADWRTETYHEHFAVRNRIPAWEGIRNAQFKYARFFDEENYEFLYDLKADPDELKNLAKDPAHADTLKQMRERTTAVVASYGGPLPPLKGGFQNSTDPHPVASANNAVKPGKDGFASLFDGKSLRGWSGEKCAQFGWASGALAATLLTDYGQPADEEQVWSIWKGNARVRR